MTRKEVALLLVREGVATQKARAEEYTDANRNPSLKPLGNAIIANCLEMLGGLGVVTDVQPTISDNEMGFVYRIAPELVEELSSREQIARLINDAFDGPPL